MKTIANNRSGLLEELWKLDRHSRFNVTIIYETPADGILAKRFSNRLCGEAATGRELILNVWNFNILGIPEIRDFAAGAASTADALIFSTSKMKTLPAHIEEWIETWSSRLDSAQPAMVALHPGAANGRVPIHASLEDIARSRGFDFFLQTYHHPQSPRRGTRISIKETNSVEGECAACG